MCLLATYRSDPAAARGLLSGTISTVSTLFEGLTQPQAALLAGVLGALGAIVASLIANVIGHLLTFKAQDRRRHDEPRRAAFIQVGRAVLSAWDGYSDDGTECEDVDEILGRRASARDAIIEAQLLTRSKRTDTALGDLSKSTGYVWHRRDRSWPEIDRQLYAAFNRFIDASRREIGLPRIEADSYEAYRRDVFGDQAAR